MPFSHHLEGLTEREAIVDALHRTILGIDANDEEMCNSGFVSNGDCTMVMSGQAIEGLENMKKFVFDRVGPMDTLHSVTNVRIDHKQGETEASITANATATHCRPGEGMDGSGAKFTSAGIYYIDLVKEVEDWKIKRWELKMNWMQGDRSVMAWYEQEKKA